MTTPADLEILEALTYTPPALRESVLESLGYGPDALDLDITGDDVRALVESEDGEDLTPDDLLRIDGAMDDPAAAYRLAEALIESYRPMRVAKHSRMLRRRKVKTAAKMEANRNRRRAYMRNRPKIRMARKRWLRRVGSRLNAAKRMGRYESLDEASLATDSRTVREAAQKARVPMSTVTRLVNDAQSFLEACMRKKMTGDAAYEALIKQLAKRQPRADETFYNTVAEAAFTRFIKGESEDGADDDETGGVSEGQRVCPRCGNTEDDEGFTEEDGEIECNNCGYTGEEEDFQSDNDDEDDDDADESKRKAKAKSKAKAKPKAKRKATPDDDEDTDEGDDYEDDDLDESSKKRKKVKPEDDDDGDPDDDGDDDDDDDLDEAWGKKSKAPTGDDDDDDDEEDEDADESRHKRKPKAKAKPKAKRKPDPDDEDDDLDESKPTVTAVLDRNRTTDKTEHYILIDENDNVVARLVRVGNTYKARLKDGTVHEAETAKAAVAPIARLVNGDAITAPEDGADTSKDGVTIQVSESDIDRVSEVLKGEPDLPVYASSGGYAITLTAEQWRNHQAALSGIATKK